MPSDLLDVNLPLTPVVRAGVTSFVAEAPRLTAAASLALHAGDAPRLAEVAHQLHEISDPIGATRVSRMAQLLEQAAEAGRLKAIPDDHGLGLAMAGAVRDCRELLQAQG